MPHVLVNLALAIPWFWPHFLGWVGGDIHDSNLRCPSGGCWQWGGQLISTSPIKVPCPHCMCQHTTRDVGD